MLLDPSESRLSRISRWAVWVLIVAGILIYDGGLDLQALWRALGAVIIAGGVYLFIQAVIVDPLKNQIRELERKIDRLGRLIKHDTD